MGKAEQSWRALGACCVPVCASSAADRVLLLQCLAEFFLSYINFHFVISIHFFPKALCGHSVTIRDPPC